MLQLTATGNVGKDATVTQTGNDFAINFSIATNRKYRTAQGVDMEQTTWLDCTIWRKQGESLDLAQYIKAGTKMMVQGQPDVRTYLNKGTGEVVPVITLRVFSQELLSSLKKEEPAAKPEPGSLPPSAFDNEEGEQPAATTPAGKKKPAAANK